nr:10389_t:CDS:2 [Entrophospora candida]
MPMIDCNVELKVPDAPQPDQHIVLKTWHKQWQFPRAFTPQQKEIITEITKGTATSKRF